MITFVLIACAVADDLFGHAALRDSSMHWNALAERKRKVDQRFEAQHTLIDVDEQRASFHYDVTMNECVVHLDDAFRVLHGLRHDAVVRTNDMVWCHGKEGKLVFRDERVAKGVRDLIPFEAGSCVVTSATVRCEGDRLPLMLRVEEDQGEDACVWRGEVVENPLSLFAHGSIRFESTRMPRMNSVVHKKAGVRNEAPVLAKRGIFDDIANALVDIITAPVKQLVEMAKFLDVVIDVIGEAVTYIGTGEFDFQLYGVLFAADWNYDAGSMTVLVPETQVASLDGVECRDCFLQIDLGILLDWKVEQYTKISDFALLLRGDATAALRLLADDRADVTGQHVFFRDILLPEVEIRLQLGPVPIFMSFSLDVELGLRGALSLTGGSLDASLRVEGCAEYGFELNRKTGIIEPVDRVVFRQSHALKAEEAQLSGSTGAVVAVYASARTYIKLQRIGGPYVLVEPTLEVALHGGNGVCAALNWGVDVGIGGFVSIAFKAGEPLLERKWPAKIVTKVKETLLTSCGGSRKRDVALDNFLIAGAAFRGYQEGCNVEVNGGVLPFYLMSVSLQFLESPLSNGDSFHVAVSYVGAFGNDDNPLLLAGADRDRDGVVDFEVVQLDGKPWQVRQSDLCSFTTAVAGAKGNVDARGCAADQLPDWLDQDRDGVPNIDMGDGVVDKCPLTRNGWAATVVRFNSSTELGCSACDLGLEGCNDKGASIITDVNCWMLAIYEGKRVDNGAFEFVRLTSGLEDLKLDGGWRARGFRRLSAVNEEPFDSNDDIYCSRTPTGRPGCPCRNRGCDSNHQTFYECRRDVLIGGVKTLHGVCVAKDNNPDCVGGEAGCQCTGAGFCDRGLHCIASFCVYPGAFYVSIEDSSLDRPSKFEKSIRDPSFARVCSAFSETVDLVPIERFSGQFEVDSTAGLASFRSRAVLLDSNTDPRELSSFTSVTSCKRDNVATWHLFANDDTARAVATFPASGAVPTTSLMTGNNADKASPSLKFTDSRLLNVSNAIDSATCKYKHAVGIDVYAELNRAKALESLGGKVANQRGVVRKLFDYMGTGSVPQGSLPSKEMAKKSSGNQPQGNFTRGRVKGDASLQSMSVLVAGFWVIRLM